jgi:iron complex outermembrane recepter protein
VPGTFTRQPTDLGIHYAGYPVAGCTPSRFAPGATPTCQVPPGAPVINNNNIAANAINPVTYQGIRVSGLWDINNDWNALLTQSYQNIEADGVFYQMPSSSDGVPLPKQSVTLFNDSYNKDKFENTALTINGRINELKLVYTGAYLVRNIRCRTTRIMLAAYMRIITSATARSRRTGWLRPAIRRVPLGTRPSAIRTRVTSFD